MPFAVCNIVFGREKKECLITQDAARICAFRFFFFFSDLLALFGFFFTNNLTRGVFFFSLFLVIFSRERKIGEGGKNLFDDFLYEN